MGLGHSLHGILWSRDVSLLDTALSPNSESQGTVALHLADRHVLHMMISLQPSQWRSSVCVPASAVLGCELSLPRVRRF